VLESKHKKNCENTSNKLTVKMKNLKKLIYKQYRLYIHLKNKVLVCQKVSSIVYLKLNIKVYFL
jgi:hypothetical protein